MNAPVHTYPMLSIRQGIALCLCIPQLPEAPDSASSSCRDNCQDSGLYSNVAHLAAVGIGLICSSYTSAILSILVSMTT